MTSGADRRRADRVPGDDVEPAGGAAPLHALGSLLRERADGHRASDARDNPDTPDAVLPSRPDTVVWGHIPAARAPVVTVASGDVVRIDTLSHQGLLTDRAPVDFFAAFGVAAAAVLPDATEVHRDVQRPMGAGGHVLTGPVWVDGARPGDTLEVRLLDATPRVPFGVNHGAPGAGVLPDLLTRPSTRVLVLDEQRHGFPFAEGILVPLAPFPGIVTVAPPPQDTIVSSRPPGPWGGNLDCRDLEPGASLFLPVFADGAQCYVGDPHAAQGDGEVNGTAIEQSMTFTVQFLLHKDLALASPMAETPTAYLAMGIDEDLDVALRRALRNAVDFLVGYCRGTLTPDDAYALCSIAVDFEITEAVNHTKVVHGRIAKDLFSRENA